ncbi:transposase [Niallia sp. 01092]|uniref:transposase n=1 Tax=unclassified Niallia TaxID=2837522 RepID=UPI003FD06281
MASCIYDIENNFIVKALITNCNDSERAVAVKLLDSFKAIRSNHDLFLFDRGYPSIDFFHYLMEAQVKFIVRTPIRYYMATIKQSETDQIIELKQCGKKGKVIRLRAIRFTLESGEEELLLTNIEEELRIDDFKVLYFKRWGIETKYDELKNKLHIQKFTGDTVLSIEQDFYATIFLANMAALVKQEADEIIAKKQRGKELKYEYTANQRLLIGKLKDNFIQLMLEKSVRRRNKLYKKY